MKISAHKFIILAVFVAAVILSKYLNSSPEEIHEMHHEMTVTNDRQFLEMMVPHHQEAVDTAQEILERGENTELKTLAKNIISAQTAEISQMQAWHQQWFNSELKPSTHYMPMMRPLKDLSGAELDKQFAQDMIAHHEGAIEMARQLQTFTEQPELKTLAKNIIVTQTTEIEELKSIL